MTNADERQDELIRLLAPHHHMPPQVADPSGPAGAELFQQITRPSKADSRRPLWLPRLRFLLMVPAAAALAALVFVLIGVLSPDSGPVAPAPAHAALEIVQDGDFIVIRILDPIADPQRYQAELDAYGLDVELSMAPVDPDQIGRVIFSEEGLPGIEWIEDPGNCTANGSCNVGIRVPVNYPSYARFVFGRAALAGECVEGGTSQEQQQAKDLRGKRVSQAREILATRGQTAQYRVGGDSQSAGADQVPGDWYVYDTAPLCDNVVILWADPNPSGPPVPPWNPSVAPTQVVAP